MKSAKIHIGTSGWSYKDWKELFYPKELKTTEWLSYYAQTFSVTEINTSFYHLPKKQTVEGWVQKVPSGFLFCPKMSRYLTHFKRLKEPEESLEKFFEVFEPMQKQMGPVLIQLPPSLKFDQRTAEDLYLVLTKDYPDYSFAMEVRHRSWMDDESFELLKRYNIAFVISQSGRGFPYAENITADNIYIRFHGPGKLYASSYSDEMLSKFSSLFKKWVKEKHSVWAFFNNDYFGYAINNAITLEKQLGILVEQG